MVVVVVVDLVDASHSVQSLASAQSLSESSVRLQYWMS